MSDPQHPDAAGTPGPGRPELDADVAIEEPGAVSPDEETAAAGAGGPGGTAQAGAEVHDAGLAEGGVQAVERTAQFEHRPHGGRGPQ